MKRITVNDKNAVNGISAEVGGEEVGIERNAHAIAMVVPFDDDDREWYTRERGPALIELIARARKQIENG
jgi:hypothetical protein